MQVQQDQIRLVFAENRQYPARIRETTDVDVPGEFEDQQVAQKRLAVIVPISLALILMLLYGLFSSLRDSLLALAGIRFAICGGVMALYLAGVPFSHTETGSAGLCHQVSESLYFGQAQGSCYVFDLAIHTVCPPEDEKHFSTRTDLHPVQDQLRAILATVRFGPQLHPEASAKHP